MSDLLTDGQRAEIGRRVHDGALLLDKSVPEGWAPMLHRDRDILDVGSVDDCPLAIVYGGYAAGLSALGLVSAEASLLGFTIVVGDGLDDGSHGIAWDNAAWDAMTQAWVREVAQRLTAAAT